MRFIQFLTELETINSFEEWKKIMMDRGMTDLLQETEFNTNHVYALKDLKLIGLWNLEWETGVVYNPPGMSFDKRRRTFKRWKI